jgi:hypothetical protein
VQHNRVRRAADSRCARIRRRPTYLFFRQPPSVMQPVVRQINLRIVPENLVDKLTLFSLGILQSITAQGPRLLITPAYGRGQFRSCV